MSIIKKLSELQLRELSSNAQKNIFGGFDVTEYCNQKFGPCPAGSIHVVRNDMKCYCAPMDEIGSGGGSGGSENDPCNLDICMPGDSSSAWIVMSSIIGNKL